MTPINTCTSYQEPTHEEIALSAFLTWEKEGRQAGCELNYWLRAESEIRSQRQKKAEAVVAQAAKQWPSASSTARQDARSRNATKGAKARLPEAPKLIAKVERETALKFPAAKAALPPPARRTVLKPTR